ncbi:MAG: NAD(P)/FAD-dependent oxidoreductase [Deltaproteobacteria bacterium]
MPRRAKTWDIVIVGAGAAGVGFGALLQFLELRNFTILERHEVGASFSRWPKEMRFISPSFSSNSFGLVDLNAVTPNTSPAFTLKTEHPSGGDYASYLMGVSKRFKLPLQLGIDVLSMESRKGRGFILHTSHGDISSRFVVWAAGEFQYPRANGIPGAEHCIHSSSVSSWAELPGDEHVIIGGYESGIDAAVNLAALGRRVTVIDKKDTLKADSSDPSCNLSPHTMDRLRRASSLGEIKLVSDVSVSKIERAEASYTVSNGAGVMFSVDTPPILATGYAGSLGLIAPHFQWHEKRYPLLGDSDESTIAPGLFLIGPAVRHGELNFCFIYKFRQRFAVVAKAIVERLGAEVDATAFDFYRQKGMFLDDLSCCGEECACGPAESGHKHNKSGGDA